MKSFISPFIIFISIVTASLNNIATSSDTVFTRSSLSTDEDNFFYDPSSIFRRDESSPPNRVFSPTVLRAQDAALVSDRNSLNSATQRATTPLASIPHGSHSNTRALVHTTANPPNTRPQSRSTSPNTPVRTTASLSSTLSQSPPVSPRTAGRRADEAERVAAQVRDRYHVLVRSNRRRAGIGSRLSPYLDPREDLLQNIWQAEREIMAAEAKRQQVSAYRNAAHEAHAACRQERCIRNSQKAKASTALFYDHVASSDLIKSSALHRYGETVRTQRLARSPNLPGREVPLQQSRAIVEMARNRKIATSREVQRLRDFEEGKDTQSSSSDSE